MSRCACHCDSPSQHLPFSWAQAARARHRLTILARLWAVLPHGRQTIQAVVLLHLHQSEARPSPFFITIWVREREEREEGGVDDLIIYRDKATCWQSL